MASITVRTDNPTVRRVLIAHSTYNATTIHHLSFDNDPGQQRLTAFSLDPAAP